MMSQNEIREMILKAAANIDEIYQHIRDKEIAITPINEKIKGHYSSNFFFQIKTSQQNKNQLIEELKKIDKIQDAEIVRNYLNITLTPAFFIDRIQEIVNKDILIDIGKNEPVNVEFCSVNPTGFLHIGHARNALLGDSIARILTKSNYKVTKEYYVNDGGRQIDLMTESIYARYCEKNGEECDFPENGYTGKEMYDVAKLLPLNVTKEEIKPIALKFFIENIKKDLKKMNIAHDVWAYESEIIAKGYVEKAIKILDEKNMIVFEKRTEKRVAKGETSENNLMLLKTSTLGDDQDRPLTKSDGSWTYFAPDLGYHLNKIERGFPYLICVVGADHDSYAKRIKIATKLLKEDIKHNIEICQMVSFENEGNLVKFSKRLGNSIRIADFITEINPDILRFLILEKSPETQFIFNYENASNITMKNPLFYCQYAFARACSIIRNIETLPQPKFVKKYSDLFENEDIQSFVITLDWFTTTLKESVKELAPHKMVHYTKKLCEKMHKLWQIGKIDSKNRIIVENIEETHLRKLLIQGFIKVAKECFDCIGIQTLEKME